MHEWMGSIGALLRGTARRFWWFVPGVAVAGVDLFERITGESVDVPSAVTWGTLGLGFAAAVVAEYHDVRSRALALERAAQARADAFPAQLDDLIREGVKLLDEFSDPEPPTIRGGPHLWGDPPEPDEEDEDAGKLKVWVTGPTPDERREMVLDLRSRAYDLLVAHDPASIPEVAGPIRDVHDKYQAKVQETLDGVEGPPALILRMQADREHSKVLLHALLGGLREIRHRLSS